MSAAKHTPGPWDKGRAGGIGQVFNADGRKVCDVMTNLGDLNLIATAPKMLEALEVAHRYLRAKNFDAGGRDAVAFVLETAIAKATGSAQ